MVFYVSVCKVEIDSEYEWLTVCEFDCNYITNALPVCVFVCIWNDVSYV
jgi:hypothetical protein